MEVSSVLNTKSLINFVLCGVSPGDINLFNEQTSTILHIAQRYTNQFIGMKPFYPESPSLIASGDMEGH